MAHDVFISHSSKDKSTADAIVAHFERSGIRCWVAPRDILPGANWATSILKAIAESKLMVLVFSGHTNGSQHIHREVERAVHHGIPIAPIRVQDARPTDDLEYFLSTSHWMDAMTPPFEQHLFHLAEKIKVLLNLAPRAPVVRGADLERPPPTHRPRRLHPAAQGGIVGAALLAIVLWSARGNLGRPFRAANQGRADNARGTGAASTPAATSTTPASQNAPLGRFTNSIGMTFVRIEPGEFMMGTPETEPGHTSDEKLHRVRLTRPYLLQTTEVTQKQWRAVMGDNPSHFKGDDLPVETVSWDGAVEFCRKLSQREGRNYRLPTEAEWEYACRAGTSGAFAGTGRLDDMGWFADNSGDAPLDSQRIWDKEGDTYFKRITENGSRTRPVRGKGANAWGLFDMHGNVYEWCSDYFAEYPEGDAVDPKGPAEGDAHGSRVVRGGSWNYFPRDCRAGYRSKQAPDQRGYFVGFRVSLDSSG